jgi:hypothetical protein
MDAFKKFLLVVAAVALMVAPAQATLISVSGPTSTAGTAAAIIGAPSDALDDIVTNTGMQGFDERQDVLLAAPLAVDGGVIAAGTRVNSHMIFLNSEGSTDISHRNVVWTFDGIVLGVMSDSGGTLEAASTALLGNPLTNYTTTFLGSGPAAPYAARGLEAGSIDGYTQLGNQLTVTMRVTEPGDWIRVVTAVPEPGTVMLLGLGLLGLGVRRKN